MQARWLAHRYGAVTAVSLVNLHGSEGRLAAAFDQLVAHGASQHDAPPFSLVPFDFHKECGKTNYACAASPIERIVHGFLVLPKQPLFPLSPAS